MRKEKNKRTFSQITLIIFGICIILISSIEIHASYNDPAQNQDNNFEVKAATLLISHEPIRIDGNSALEAFCAGNGTNGLSWETAFTIENYSITSGNESGIFINSTDKFLIINNCSIENFLASKEYGIEIQNCSNILITMCSLINSTYGIYLDSSTNNTLIQNNCSFNDYGITLVNSESNTLFNNTVLHNIRDGIRFTGSSNNNISTNTVNFNKWNGIYLNRFYSNFGYVYSNENLIINNSFEENLDNGIRLLRSDRNSILGNSLLYNRDSGISLDSSSHNTLSFNSIYENYFAGLDIEDYSEWNLILENNFNSNHQFGIILSRSSYNTISENLISNHNEGIRIEYDEEDQREQNIYDNIFEDTLNDITYVEIYNDNSSALYYFLYPGIPVIVIIGIAALLIINRKKIKKRWKKSIAKREIKKNERKIKRAKRSEIEISNISKNSVENIDRKDSKLIYKILKVIFWIVMIVLFIGLSIITYFIFDALVLIICIIYREKINNRWQNFISQREIRKSERKIEREKKSKKKSKSSKRLVKNMNRKDSKSFFYTLNKILKFILWSAAFFTIFLGIGASISERSLYFLIEIPILILLSLSFIYRKKIRNFNNDFRSKLLIKIGQNRTEKAIDYAKMHKYKRSRSYWLSSERIYNRALGIIPDFHKIDFLEKKIISIKQNTLATYLSEGIVLSKIAWFQFQENHFSQAKKQYSKSISTIELVLQNIDAENVFSEEEEFPITASLIVEILQFLEKNLNQIKNKEKNKKKSKVFIKSSDIQETSEKIVKSIKEMNESLWIYCQSLDSHENLLDLDGLSKILEDKLTKSEKMLNSAQEQMQYLLYYMQSSNKKYERNGFETKNVAMNINRTVEQERIENIHMKIIREYEYIGGKIRLKVGIVNRSDNVLTNLALRFDLPDSLKWIIHEPNLKRRGDTIHIARLGGNEKIAISLYLEPINCLESMINATLTYFDSKDQPQAVIMAPKKVSISCPIFFTREEANLARVKKIQLQLKFEDRKIFPLVKSDKSELIFNKILSSIGKHDVKLVNKEYSLDNNKGEAYFYGVTKVKKDKMIIRLLLDSNHQIIEISVNGDEQEPITGLLAELESEIRDKLLVHNIIEDSDKFHDINTSILLGNCPFCNGPISQNNASFFKKGETIQCKYCDTALTPY
jgi:parallel beta-helix repeat protein